MKSESRKALTHIVDLEPQLDDSGKPEAGGFPFACTCESFYYNVERPCKHIRGCVHFIAKKLKRPKETKVKSKPIPAKKTYVLDTKKKFKKRK